MLVRRLRTLALTGSLLAPLSLASAHPKPQADLLDRAVAVWSKVKTARATFEQTIVNSLTGRTMTATGEYQQQRPGKLSVRFSDPADERIVADGKHLWLYLPSSAPGQVIRTSMKDGGSGTVDLSAQFLTAPRSRYTVVPAGTLAVGGRATHAFTLTPKSKEGAPFQTATVWIDDADATIRQFDVTELSGVQRKVRLTSFKTNVAVDASAFQFALPAGVRIVDR
ncbi:MAG: outer rane lipoprotein carrier protein LolA [Gemmatimonadetes bacterium]|nr:outer rane lipoprotein carrier protein LolA [Gemmatimonadota bacterium]